MWITDFSEEGLQATSQRSSWFTIAAIIFLLEKTVENVFDLFCKLAVITFCLFSLAGRYFFKRAGDKSVLRY